MMRPEKTRGFLGILVWERKRIVIVLRLLRLCKKITNYLVQFINITVRYGNVMFNQFLARDHESTEMTSISSMNWTKKKKKEYIRT